MPRANDPKDFGRNSNAQESIGPDGIGLKAIRALVFAYPPSFRRRYREPIVQSVRDGLRETTGEGRCAGFAFWRRAVCDLAVGGLRMRARKLLGRPEIPHQFTVLPPNGSRDPKPLFGRLRQHTDILSLDLRHSMRSMAQTPVMSAAAIGTLAVAIALTTTTFGIVYGTTMRDLPYEGPDRLVDIQLWGQPPDRRGRGSSGFGVEALAGNVDSFVAMGQFREYQASLDVDDSIGVMPAAEVTPGLFELLGVTPVVGRVFNTDDVEEDANATVVLGYSLWQTRFGGDRDAVGRTVVVNEVPRTIIGIMPEAFSFSYYARLWLPLGSASRLSGYPIDAGVVARLQDGVSLEEANVELEVRRQQLAAADVRPFNDPSEGWVFHLEAKPLGWERFDSLGWMPFSALLPVGLALLVACANVAGLLLARGVRRRHEMTLRAVVGGSRGRLMRHLLTESVLMASAAGVLGLLLVNWTGTILERIVERVFDEAFPFGFALMGIDSPIPGWLRITPDTTVVLFAIGASAVVIAAIGLVPARESSRPDLGAALRAGGYGATPGRGARRWQTMLAATQIAISVILIAAASLTLRSAASLARFDSGMDIEPLLELRFGVNDSLSESSDPRMVALKEQAIERYGAMPEVDSVTSVWFVERDAVDRRTSVNGDSFSGVAYPDALTRARRVLGRVVGPDHFRTLGMEVLRGRGIEAQDRAGAERVVVVSESTATLGWPGEDPLGRELRLIPDGPPYTVVGVVADQRRSGVLSGASLQNWLHVYVSSAQVGSVPRYLLVRATTDALQLVEPLRRVARELDPAVPLSLQRPRSVENESIMVPVFRWSSRVLTAIGLSALVLSAIGIYGVVAYSAARRSREMGLRSALGADTGALVRIVLRDGVVLAGFGILFGIIGALAVGRVLSSLLYGVSAFDVPTYAVIAVAILALTVLAGLQPARRAARVDPVATLREE